jgi:hypothetical protein
MVSISCCCVSPIRLAKLIPLAVGDLDLRHVDGPLVVPDHAVQKEPRIVGGAGLSSYRISSSLMMLLPPPWCMPPSIGSGARR